MSNPGLLPSYFVESNLTFFVVHQVGVFVYVEGAWKIIAFCFQLQYMGLDVRKPVFWGLQTTKAQTSLRIRAD